VRAPKVNVQVPDINITPMGMLVGVGILVALYLAYKAYQGGAYVANAVSNFDNDLAGALVPDANAAVQALTGNVQADLKANGYPPVGSALYNQIVTRDGDAIAAVGTAGLGTGSS
jgi:hypothetical protein